jgi:hypothetical protein
METAMSQGKNKDNPKFIVMLGAMVHYVTPEGVHLPAMVVRVWSDNSLNLSVFIDHETYTGDPIFPARVIPYSEDFSPNTWHTPEPIELPRSKRDKE